LGSNVFSLGHIAKRQEVIAKALALIVVFIISTASVAVLTGYLVPVYAPSTTATLTEWAIPTANSGPVSIALDPSGKCCWFVESFTNNIAHFDPSTNTFQEWAIPTASSTPEGLAATTISGMTALIGTELQGNKVFVFFPSTGIIKEYALPTANSNPEYVSVEPSGALTRAWFTEAGRNAWGELVYDPVSTSANIYEDTFPAAVGGIANGLSAGSGTIWFAGAKAIVKFDRSTLQYSMWTLPAHGTSTGRFLALDSSGQVLYTQGTTGSSDTTNYVGVLRGDNTFKDWQIPTTGADPRGISINSVTQQPWIAEYAYSASSAKIALLDPSAGGTVTGAFPTTQAYAGGFTPVTPAVIGPIATTANTASPTSSTNAGITTGPITEWALAGNSGPHDLVVDSNGDVWIVESNANKIAKLSLSQPDFSLDASPGTISIPQGGSGTVTITGSSILSYSGSVTLSVTGSAPSGVTFSTFSTNPVNIPAGSTASATLTINVASDATLGPATITLSGTSGPITHTTTFTLTVTSGADFSLTLSSPTLTVGSGSSATETATLTSIGTFNSEVSLTASGLIGGVHVSFSPSSVTPSAGGTATSTATVTVDPGTPAATATLTITGTSDSLAHSQTFDLTITITPDFTISASPGSITMNQGDTQTSTVTVGSTNGFNSAVSLTYSWVGSAPSDVPITLPGPVTPPSGSTATSTLTVSATSSSSTGSFTLQVTGTSGSLTHNVNIGITINTATATTSGTATGAPHCVIATATYGSEMAPEVQLLRNFRDYSIMRTKAGSGFMIAFNAWYYSFSPSVAGYLTTHGVERTIMKGVLYPLVGTLFLTSNLFTATQAYPEVAVLLSGLFAIILIGAVYLGLPLGLLSTSMEHVRGRNARRVILKILGGALLVGLGILFAGEILSSMPLLAVASSTIVLATLCLSAIITSATVSRLVAKSADRRR
jgi:streptogramin lyase